MSDDTDSGRRELLRAGLAAAAAGATGLIAPGLAKSAEGQGAAGRYKGKIVLITGATSGIGEAAAQAFAREGGSVVFCGRRSEEGRKVEKRIRDAGGTALFVRADLTKTSDLDAFFKAALEKFGRIDVAVNNAGAESEPKPFQDVTDTDWEKALSINATAVFRCMRREIQAMLKQGSGAILNVASIHGHRGPPMIPAYVASKYAVVGLARAAAMELGPKGIRVNSVSPGLVDTPLIERSSKYPQGLPKERMAMMHALGRLAQPEEIAQAMLWLGSSEASFVHGADLHVDGGYWRW